MMQGRERLLWFILARVVVVSLFLVSTIVLRVKGTGPLGHEALDGITDLIVATYGFSILSLLFIRVSTGYSQTLTYAQIVWDILFVTVLLLFTGGIASPFSFLYLLAIASASVLLARREAIYTASLCAIIYGAIIDLQYFGQLAFMGLSPLVAQRFGTNYIFYTLFINILGFFLTALLTGYLAERAQRSETELEKRAIDYEELERLNSTIVSTLSSGLLTVTNDHRIRVFNRYAESLTCLSQEEAYNRSLFDVFPGFRLFAGDVFSVKRGEFEYIGKDGRKLVIGFTSAPLTLREGGHEGALINFQDVTQVKRMEENLKKADKLAAIGELAARIAHEIRNPLAAVSGSVQLIAQSDSVADRDRRLFDIVLRETERLNDLISDFLNYARPSVPEKQPVDLHSLVAEIVTLADSDRRFTAVRIENLVPAGLRPELDPAQFRQVLWNLLVNSADAMPRGCEITVTSRLIEEVRAGGELRRVHQITIADNGPGMPPDTLTRIFEPFFSTKSGGTGLGLATVYRIVETHGGRISAESVEGKGTVFTIYIPVRGVA